MKRPPFNLILLGDVGSGKATQGKRLVKKYPFLREFDFGQWLRELKGAERRHYKVERTTAKGILAPTGLAKQKFREIILETPADKGVLFNGNPKMVGEAKVVAKTFRETGRKDILALYLAIPQKELMKRLESRRSEARADDQAEHLKNRMKYYKTHIRPTVAFLKKTYVFATIDGVGTKEEVFRRMTAAIEKFRAAYER